MTFRPFFAQWWPWHRSTHARGRPFQVLCACGRRLQGRRLWRDQTITCLDCRARHHVLADGAWPPVEDAAQIDSVPEHQSRRARYRLVLPFVVILLACVLMILQWLPKLLAPTASDQLANGVQALERARAAIRLHDWATAKRHVQESQRMLAEATSPEALHYRREVAELFQDLNVLTDLAPTSLEELVATGQSTPFADWPRLWKGQYQGKAIGWRVFGARALVAQEPGYPSAGPGQSFHIVWNLNAIDREGMADSVPGCFALRLESCRLEEQDAGEPCWVIRFQAGSLQRLRGVLLEFQASSWLDPLAWPFPEKASLEEPNLRLDLQRARQFSPAAISRIQQVWHGGLREVWCFAGPPCMELCFVARTGSSGIVQAERPTVRKLSLAAKK